MQGPIFAFSEQFMLGLLVLGFWSFIGCQGHPPNETPDSALVRRIGDTTFVSNSFLGRPDTAEMVEVTRVIRTDGPEDLQLFSWTQLTVGWRGEVYVADPNGVRMVSPDGGEMRWVARRGQGPSEIRSVAGMTVDSSGHLLVVDEGNRRITVFDTSGVVLDHWPLPPGRTGYGLRALTPVSGGEFLLPFFPAIEGPTWERQFPRAIYLRLDDMGAVLDTVFVPLRLHENCPFEDDGAWSQSYLGDTRTAYFPKVTWMATREGGVTLGCPTQFEFESVQPSGQVLRVSLDKSPYPTPSEERDWFVRSIEESAEVTGRAWKWTGPPPPATRPFYSRILVGRHGRIWIWPELPSSKEIVRGRETWRPARTGAFDVFDPDGTFVGSVSLPEGAQYRGSTFEGLFDPFIAWDTVWIFRQDSLDVKYLSKMVIQWPTKADGRP